MLALGKLWLLAIVVDVTMDLWNLDVWVGCALEQKTTNREPKMTILFQNYTFCNHKNYYFYSKFVFFVEIYKKYSSPIQEYSQMNDDNGHQAMGYLLVSCRVHPLTHHKADQPRNKHSLIDFCLVSCQNQKPTFG